MSKPDYICPKCKSPHNLEVAIKGWAKVSQSESGDIETRPDLAEDQSSTWNNVSEMQCKTEGCGFTGVAGQFLDIESKHPELINSQIHANEQK